MGTMQRSRACLVLREGDAPPPRCDRGANEKWRNRVHHVRSLAFFVLSMDPDDMSSNMAKYITTKERLKVTIRIRRKRFCRCIAMT